MRKSVSMILFLVSFLPQMTQAQELPSRIFNFGLSGQHSKSTLNYDFVEQNMNRTIRLRKMAGIGFSFGSDSYFIFSAGVQYKKDSIVTPTMVYYSRSQYKGQLREGYSNLMPAFNLAYRKYLRRPEFPVAVFYQAFLDVTFGEGKGRVERDVEIESFDLDQRLQSTGSEFEMFAGLNLGLAYFVNSNFSIEVTTGFFGYHRHRQTIEYTDLTNRKAIDRGLKADFLNAGVSISASYFF